KYPKTGSMELLLPDVNGILKGKRIRKSDFDGICKNGFFFCGGTIMLTTLGGTVPGLRYTEIDGDPDSPARLVTGSIAPVPWAKRAMGQALFRLYNDDGSNFFADPRTALESALAPFDTMGVRIVMATELEFYLLDANADRPTPSTARVPGTNRPQPGPQVYHPDDLWEVEPFMDDVYSYCEAQRIPADTAISEYAPGQFEINLHHIDDPVLACDHGVLLKRAVKAAAKKHGFVACFMAKPFTDDSGNGLHIHMSLYDRNTKNYFSHGRDKMAKPPFSARLRHAVGGLLKTMPEATAIFAPNINSYRRMRADMFAPVETNWGVNHRVVAVRIPSADSKNLRFEHRVAGADANPYLVTAAILAGVHYGLKNKIEPPRMVEQGQEIRPKLSIPNRWDNALDKFGRSKVLPGYLGEDFCEYFLTNRRHECELFHNEVSSLDHDWYLRSL
ncbi:MAG: glutamine synthetase family protein, partial [Gammaproteobacteria bacterium]|nr:glutamine synthetase family protein [Gammaproteobacteria bacterium]